LVKAGRSHDEIYSTLIEEGVAPCVAREYANEPERREKMAARFDARKARKDASKFGAKGATYRRIIQTEVWPKPDSEEAKMCAKLGIVPREGMLHATKGWRSFRVAT